MNPFAFQMFPQLYGNESNQIAGNAIAASMGLGKENQMPADPMMNPLNAYNPYALARMIQMQQYGEANGRQKLEKIAETSVQDILTERIKFASNITSQELINTDQPIFIVGFGPQNSGRSLFLKMTMDALDRVGIQTAFYRPGVEGEFSQEHNDLPYLSKISHISELYEIIEDPDLKCIFIDEIDKLGNAEEINKFVSFANSHKISVIASSQFFKHNGTVIDQLPQIVDKSNASFEFYGIDSLDGKSIAELTYTGIPVSLDGRILDSSGDTYYSNLTPLELKMIINKFMQLQGKERLMIKGPFEGHEDINEAILLPAHPKDMISSQNKSRNLALSVSNYDQLYRLANITPPPKVAFQSNKVQNLDNIV